MITISKNDFLLLFSYFVLTTMVYVFPFLNLPLGFDTSWIFLIFSNDNLEIPHPRFKERLFVLHPLSEISPNFIDPITKKTIKILLDEAKNTSD